MQRYRRYGTSFSSSIAPAPVEEVHAEEELPTEKEEYEEETEPLVEKGVWPVDQETGESDVLT